jgi:hypothetical protein
MDVNETAFLKTGEWRMPGGSAPERRKKTSETQMRDLAKELG